MGLWYTSRGEVKESLQFGDTAVIDRAVDSALEYASRKAETDFSRLFLPWLATRYFDFPTPASPYSWRLWLDGNPLLSASAIVAGGETLAAADYLLGPPNVTPFDRIELNLSRSGSLSGGDTYQRDVAVTGLWGEGDDSSAAGALTSAVLLTDVTIAVSDGSLLDVGSILRADDERMSVVRTSWQDSGQNITAGLTDERSDVLVGVTDGTAYHEGELLLIDAERVRITDVAGNNLIVERAADGSVLAAHTLGADVYARRLLTVQRGVLGTTAAAHADDLTLTRYDAPGVLKEFVIAEAICNVLQKASGYARVIGEGEGTRPASGAALEDARKAAAQAYAPRARTRAV